MPKLRKRLPPRPAFTLVEMLVVIAIIAILSAITVGAVIKMTSAGKLSNTRSIMGSIDKTLKEHWAYVVAEAKKETGLSVPFAVMNATFGPDATGGDRNRIIWIKMRLMEAFPVSFAEVANPYPYATGIIPTTMRKYNATYQQALAAKKAGTLATTESSACLLMSLAITRNGTSLSSDVLGTSYVTDTDGDAIPELVDGWGNPLTFFRFPTQNPYLQAALPVKPGAKAKFADPLDPDGVFLNWAPSIFRTKFETNVHVINFGATATASYVVPTIVSSGPDGIPGLNTTVKNNMAVVPPVPPKIIPDEADNVYSFLLGGTGMHPQ